MGDELNTPTHLWYQPNYNIPLAKKDFSKQWIYSSGIQQIDDKIIRQPLFGASESGAWYDPSDLTTMFQDSAGTTPVTAAGQPVGCILDKSGNGFHATQSTAASRPTYGVVPSRGRVNLLTFTEQFGNAVSWSATDVAVVSEAASAPNGTITADRIVPNTVLTGQHNIVQPITGVVLGQQYTISVFVKAAGYNWVRIGFSASFPSNWLFVNVATGAVGLNSAYSNILVTDQGDGWWRVSASITATASGSSSVLVYPLPSNNFNSFSGDGTSGILLWGAQLETGSTATTYQRVVSQFDVTDPAGFPSYPLHYLSFDGVDDFLVTPTITPNTDKVQVFAGVRKLSDAAQGIIVELTTSAGVNAGSFNLQGPGVSPAQYRAVSGGSAVGAGNASVSAGYAAPVSNIFSAQFDISGDSLNMRLNGVLASNSAGDQGTGNFSNAVVYIGRRAGTSLPFNGQLYGLITRFSTANLDASVISQTERWMGGKTGVTIA